MSGNILMGTDNEHGWKLEDLLEKIRKEVKAKSAKIKESPHPQRDMILTNNGRIMEHLHNAISYQKETYRQLDAVAPNRGPKHPRL